MPRDLYALAAARRWLRRVADRLGGWLVAVVNGEGRWGRWKGE